METVHSAKYRDVNNCYLYIREEGNDLNYLKLVCVENQTEKKDIFTSTERISCLNSPSLGWLYGNVGFPKNDIESIYFEDCDLQQIPSDIFGDYQNVQTFHMYDLRVKTLHSSDFNGATKLQKVFAQNNEISEIPANLFKDSKSIVEVNFSNNKIQTIDGDVFATAEQLTFLDLSYNKLTNLSVKIFQNLINLKRLLFSHNQIEEIPSFLFHKTVQLVEINFSFNKIKKIDDFAFFSELILKKLNLSHNQLTTVDKQIWEKISNLTHLDISFNKFTFLSPETFKNYGSLELLDLSGNPMKTVNREMFVNLVKLQHLNLSRIDLLEVKPQTFSSLENLQTLDLSHNNLKTLDDSILSPQANQLKLLLIANNQLRELNGFTSTRIPNTKIVGIDSNQFNCSFLKTYLQSITPNNLDLMLHPLNCSSFNEAIGETHRDEKSLRRQESSAGTSTDGNNLSTKRVREEQFSSSYSEESTTTEMYFDSSTTIVTENIKQDVIPTKVGRIFPQKDERILISSTTKQIDRVSTPKEAIEYEAAKNSEHTMKIEENNLLHLNINNSRIEHNVAIHKLHGDIDSMKNCLFVMMCLMATVFGILVLMAMATWKFLRSKSIGAFGDAQVFYKRDEVDLPNAVENNTYEVIKFNKA